MAAPILPSPVRVGDLVAGKYRIERLLGSGGMGLVFEATHILLKQRVAVKFLADAPGAPGNARFLREAQALASLRGEHVVRVTDMGTLESGSPYFVMEHLDGVSLRQVIEQRGRLPIEEAIDYLLQACSGIAEAHARGIVHRDLKPSNLFLVRADDGTVTLKILDFGISKFASENAGLPDLSLTDTGEFLGSPKYMAPEQIRGAKTLEPRTDIWALGVIAYELTSGRAPFVGDTMAAVLASVSADTPAALRSHRNDVPPELDAAITRCLQKQVELRFETVAEFAKAIAPFTPSGAEQAERLTRLNPGRRSLAPKKTTQRTDVHEAPNSNEATGTLRSVFGKQPPARPRGRSSWNVGAPLGVMLIGAAWWLIGHRAQRDTGLALQAEGAHSALASAPPPTASAATVAPDSASLPAPEPAPAASRGVGLPPASPVRAPTRKHDDSRSKVAPRPAPVLNDGTSDRK